MDKQKLEMLKQMFPEEVDRIEAGQCPCCGQTIDQTSFKDQISKDEFEISGMCQECQDLVFIAKDIVEKG